MYTPIYKRAPNKFIEYNERAFTDGAGNSGVEKVAIFHDKNGKKKEMTVFVKWSSKQKMSGEETI